MKPKNTIRNSQHSNIAHITHHTITFIISYTHSFNEKNFGDKVPTKKQKAHFYAFWLVAKNNAVLTPKFMNFIYIQHQFLWIMVGLEYFTHYIAHVHICTYVCMVHVCEWYMCMVHVYGTCVYAHMYVCTCACVYVYICVCVHICVYLQWQWRTCWRLRSMRVHPGHNRPQPLL